MLRGVSKRFQTTPELEDVGRGFTAFEWLLRPSSKIAHRCKVEFYKLAYGSLQWLVVIRILAGSYPMLSV